VLSQYKCTVLHAFIITQNSWSSSLTFSYGRYFMIISATTQAIMEEVMEKTRLGQMKPRELPWPPRLPPLKSSDHRSPALRWSLFIFNIELGNISLEVRELNLMNLTVYRRTALHLLGINATVRLSQIKKKRV
jgi:hypothetical protein